MYDKKFKVTGGYEIPAMGFGTWDLRGKNGQKAIEEALDSIGFKGFR